MAVKFISHVEADKVGGWYIKLTDTLEDKTVVCKDLNVYKEKIEELGGEYGNDIEVVWTRSQLLTPQNYQELEDAMAKLQEEYKEEIDQLNNGMQENPTMNGGFNPNE